MCGIAGAIDLTGRRPFPRGRVLAMTRALAHRGPDDEQAHLEDGLAMGTRRLAFIDVANGRQPMANETGTVWVAQEGELYEYPELRRDLIARGHSLRTHCDTEAWVHLYEDFGEDLFQHTRGQYAVSLWDRDSRTLLLGRDRAGIAPLFYVQTDGWLLWASEIKALFASGLVEPAADRRGLDFFFNFFAISGPRTCFEGVHQLLPGHYLRARDGEMVVRRYADVDYPDAGAERRDLTPEAAGEELEALLRDAIRRRLVGEAEVCGYLSGGLDSSLILALASEEHGSPLKSFNVSLDRSGPTDEGDKARNSAHAIGSTLTTVRMTTADICDAFPELIVAAESPVLDTASACMVRLAEAIRPAGCKTTLTGEGADEALAGYVWFKIASAGLIRGNPIQRGLRGPFFRAFAGRGRLPPFAAVDGLRPAQQITYEMMGYTRQALYAPAMWDALGDYSPYDELGLDTARMRRWHPLNQSLYVAYKVMMAGMLLAAKGDRPIRNASVEGRFPFLDERVVDFCASLPPDFKLRGLTDKWLLRQVAAKTLPKQIAGRRKTMFRAHMSSLFLGAERPPWVDQLLSPESLRRTGYFDPAAVAAAREHRRWNLFGRTVSEMGLTGVITTQLWHHTYLGGGLADLPAWQAPVPDERLAAAS
jgi:asparagine synthase (glutamine-hydrolysing)